MTHSPPVGHANASEIRNDSRLADLEVSYASRRKVIWVFFLSITLLQTLLWVYLSRPFAPLVRIDQVRVLTEGAICPGDNIFTQYDLTVRAPGVVEVDTTVVQLDGLTVLTSPTRRIIFSEALSTTIETAWRLPMVHVGPAGDARQWIEGDYVRLIAISTPLRGGEPVISATPFEIGACSAHAR